jgi:hypothetical protein
MIGVAAPPTCLSKELGDAHGPHSGFARPVLVRTAFPGASSSEVLVEEQEASRIEERCEPPKRAQRRGVEISVERSEGHPTDTLSELGCE